MNKNRHKDMKERVERRLEIDIYRQAKRPHEETQKELREHGIDAAALAKEALRITKEALVRDGTQSKAPAPAKSVQGRSHLDVFFDRLSGWMAQLFPALTLQAAYADKQPGSVVHKFEGQPTDPYRARLVRDAAGQWWLRVSTSDADAARVKLRLEIEAEAPELSFVEAEPGQFMGEVSLTEDMARALQAGHRPVFKQVS